MKYTLHCLVNCQKKVRDLGYHKLKLFFEFEK